MATVITAEIRDRRVLRGIEQMGARASGLTKVMRQLRGDLRADLKRHAERESSPDGKWPRRAPSTLRRILKRASRHTYVNRERRKRGMSGPLQQGTSVTRLVTDLLGKLPLGRAGSRMRTAVIGGDELIAKSPARKRPVPGIHNVGGSAGRGSRIPARQFVFMSENFLETAREKLIDYVHEGWRRA